MGIQGNEDADELAKQAAQNEKNEIPYNLEKPISNLKRTQKEIILKQCQLEWDYGDWGRTAYQYFTKVNTSRLVSCKLQSQIYTDHG